MHAITHTAEEEKVVSVAWIAEQNQEDEETEDDSEN